MRDSAVAAALAVARAHGLAAERATVLHDRWNVVVGLEPEPVVMRVATVTAQVRAARIEALLRRETALLAFLAGRGAPAVRPPDVMPAGPHVHDGFWVVAMARVEHDPAAPKDFAALGGTLRHLHEAMAGYRDPVPALEPLNEVEAMLAGPAIAPDLKRRLQPVLAALRPKFEKLMAGRCQPLHGDSHRNNVLMGPDGPVWIDFEEVVYGPVGWDLACLLHRLWVAPGGPAPEVAAALSAYGLTPEQRADLPTWIEIRAFVVLIWALCLAARRGEDATGEFRAWAEHYPP